MKTTLIVILVIIAVIAVTFFVLHFMKEFFKFYYGWRLKLSFFVITFVTADKSKTLNALGFQIDDAMYRLKFYDYSSEDEVNKNLNKIFYSMNKHKNREKLISASHHTPAERIVVYTPIESVPGWIYRLCKIKWL